MSAVGVSVSEGLDEPFFHVSYKREGHEIPALEYRPNPGQLPFHMGGAAQGGGVKFRLLCGGTGSGKSLAGVVEDCMWCLRFPGVVGYIFEPTYKMIDRIVIPTLNLLLGVPFWENPVITEFNRGRMNVRWYNGSTLWLVSLDDPEQAEGGNIDFAHADEARLVKPEARWETAWRVIQRRLRGSGGGHPIGAWVTTTPNAPGSALYNFFENPKTRSPESRLYRLRLDDNVEHLPEGFIEGIKREHTGSLYQRFVEGLFAGDEAMTFAFDYSVHVQKFEEQFSRMKMGYPPESVVEREEKRGKRGFFGDVAYGVDFGWCYSEDTDVLTSRGWLKHYEIKENDLIATFDPILDTIIWDKFRGLYQQKYSGEMIEFNSRSSNFFVTPHHKCWIGKQRLRDVDFREVRAIDIVNQRAQRFLVRISSRDFSGKELGQIEIPYYYCERIDREDKTPIIDGDTWLKFLAWFICEGCAVDEKSYGVYFVQRLGKKSEMIDDVMEKLPYTIHRQEYLNEYGNEEVKWQITCKALNRWLRKNCGVYSKNKKVPEFIFNVGPRQRRLFIETLLKGDGTEGKGNRSPAFSSSSETLLDQVQRLALMSGYASTKSFYECGMGRISLLKREYIRLIKKKNIETKQYSGMIYCLITDTGYYITRRNGKPAFQGNTDPCAITAVMFDGDRRAYVLDEVYENHLSNADIADKCKEIQERWGKGAFWCDPSSPDTIDYLRKEGLNAKKGNNRRAEGIREVGGRLKDAGDGRHRLYIYEGCVNTIEELQSYNEEQKGHDHACFIAGTLIETIRGQKPIEEIQIGDYVKTRMGYHKVVASSITNPMAHVYEVSFSNGNTLVGTKDHPIWVKGLGFIKMDALRYGYMVETSDLVCDEAWQKKSFFKERLTDGILNQKIGVTDYITDQAGGVKLQNLSIEKYGKAFIERFQRDITFITKMETQPIISLKTLNLNPSFHIFQNTPSSYSKMNIMEKNRESILNGFDPWHQNGIVQRRDALGIKNTEKKFGRTENQLKNNARTVGSNMSPLLPIHGSVRINASPRGDAEQRSIILSEYANIAEKPSQQTNIIAQKHVVIVVDRNYLGREPVYNITVDTVHEYFANGILVSNCDALRYCLMGGKRRQETAWGFGSRDGVRWPR